MVTGRRAFASVPLGVSLMLVLMAVQVCAQVPIQVRAARQLTLITPDDQQFDPLLEANFPGLQEADGYKISRSLLVFVRNNTLHDVKAYAVKWEIQDAAGKINRLQTNYIQKHFLPMAERKPLIPGELRLVSPFFNISSAQYYVQHEYIAHLISSNQDFVSTALRRSISLNAGLDAVIYDDGACVGPDHFQLALRYQALRDAERDEAMSLAQSLRNNTPLDDVVRQLHQHADSGLSVKTSHLDRSTLYALYRSKEARNLLTVHKFGGPSALRRRVLSTAQQKREEIRQLPQE